MMKKVFIEENGEYGLDYSQAVWATDKMHQIYHDAKVQLADADFVIENAESIMIMEYKNSNELISLSDKLYRLRPVTSGQK